MAPIPIEGKHIALQQQTNAQRLVSNQVHREFHRKKHDLDVVVPFFLLLLLGFAAQPFQAR